jgi:DNA-binding MarR family transcriptional regulator
MTDRWAPQSSHGDAVLLVLQEIRAFSDAMDRMHSVMKDDMAMNPSDLGAIRMLIMREQRGETVSPHEVARHLRISTASTTKLLDRLSASGHVERQPHPHDRRARVVVLTDASRQAFFRSFGRTLAAMRGVAEHYGEEELRVIARFIAQVSVAIDPA